jgi:hypothetical protein
LSLLRDNWANPKHLCCILIQLLTKSDLRGKMLFPFCLPNYV